MSLKEINEEFYKLACYFNVFPGSDRTYVMLEGLKENMPKAMALFEEILPMHRLIRRLMETLQVIS